MAHIGRNDDSSVIKNPRRITDGDFCNFISKYVILVSSELSRRSGAGFHAAHQSLKPPCRIGGLRPGGATRKSTKARYANPTGDRVAVAFASEGDGCSGIVRQRIRARRKRICRGTHTERYRVGAAYEKGEACKKAPYLHQI